jgi:methylmalonyl-CoA/ethylmalonyl-CoA epimerase
MKRIEHIGIAVKNLGLSNELFTEIFGYPPYKEEAVESEGVMTSFFQIGESKIELLQGTTSESAITKFIDKKGEGIHHIAFAVDDIKSELKRLKEQGFQLIHEEPKRGADNMLIAFLHPKGTNGVLIELCQEIVG